MMITDILYAQIQAGGWVLFPIFGTGALGIFILLQSYAQLGIDMFRGGFAEFFQSFRMVLSRGDFASAKRLLLKRPGLVSRQLLPALEREDWPEYRLRNYLREEMGRTFRSLDKGMHLVTVLAATAPLLGLLGTVSGMVRTFDVITLYGNSNPVLMADGISEALITTQSGLVIAFPLILFKHRIEDRIMWLKKQMELGVTILLNQKYHIQNSASNGGSHGSL
jgi:biopolymer transport protein ExbB